MLGPTAVRWDITLNCELNCRHCSMGRLTNHRSEHPSDDTVLAVARRLRRDVVYQVGLLGGEPLSHPAISSVLRLFIEQGTFVTINTNGLLIDAPLLDLVRGNFGWSIMVSLDGSDEESHDHIRGRGRFRQTIEKIRMALELRRDEWPYIGIQCTFNNRTINSMSEIIRLAESLGLDILQLRLVGEAGNAARHYEELKVNHYDAFNALVEYFESRNSKTQGLSININFLSNLVKVAIQKQLGLKLPLTVEGCTAATTTAFVDCNGRLWPCQTLAYATDSRLQDYFELQDNSLLTHSFEEIWNSRGFHRLRELNARRLHAEIARPCSNCQFNNVCTPCPLPYLIGQSLDQPQCEWSMALLEV